MLTQKLEQTLALEQTLLGTSLPMRTLREEICAVAKGDETVLILGETGVGKELVARGIHMMNGHSAGPFAALNVPAIPHDLIESELFGHRKGAFTGAIADYEGAFRDANGGVLFLDEIGDMPFEFQAKLLRVLESGEVRRIGETRAQNVNVRVIAATNHDLKKDVEEGRFRRDLYHRLNILPITVPPLRKRKTDIFLLATTFLREKDPDRLLTTPGLWMLKEHNWPGNVRELKNAVRRACVFSGRAKISWRDFMFLDLPNFEPAKVKSIPDEVATGDVGMPTVEVETKGPRGAYHTDWRERIIATCREHPELTKPEIAHLLGLAPGYLYILIKRYGIQAETGTRIYRKQEKE